ncbi:MAG TPA: DoxX family protein [Gemmatimonadaceae bacterium]|nr:DoxX family protein [Gemmatimonadaceae bacterium]
MATRTAEVAAQPKPQFRPAIGLLEIITAIVFIGAGSAKLLGLPFMVVVFDALGAGQWFRYAVAVVEIVGAVALLSSSFVGFAAIALLPIMLGAAMTEIAFLRRPPVAAALCTVALALIAWRHLPRPRPRASTDS